LNEIPMTRILVLAHSPLASALLEVASHAFPDCATAIDAVDVGPDQNADELEALLRQRLRAAAGADTLVLVDVFGATPCNVALRVADGVHARVVTGVNVPMLWRALCYRHEPLDALVERACSGATQGVMPVAQTRRQHQSQPALPPVHDQDPHPHQQ
jgi:PTS system ascorbate-specific IIA component